MNHSSHNSDEGRLQALLKQSRPNPDLPPRFQEGVWRRIAQADSPAEQFQWIYALASLLLKPRFAVALIAAMLLAGTLLGSLNGQAQARLAAQKRYVASVAMPVAP